MKSHRLRLKPASQRYFQLAAFAILICAAGFRLAGLAQESFWFDEVHSFRKSQSGGFGAIWASLQDDVHPPFYFWILSLWLKIAPPSEAGIRSLSAIAGIAAVTALIGWGAALRLPARACLAGGLLFAVNPHAIWYSQEARMYSLEVLLGILHFALGTKLLFWARPPAELKTPARAGESRRSIARMIPLFLGYILTGAALLWTHFFGLFFLAAEAFGACILFWRLRSSAPRAAWTLAAIFGAASLFWFAAWLPLLFQMISRFRTGQGISWLSTMYQVTWRTPWEVLYYLICGPQIQGAPPALCHAAAASFLFVIAAGVQRPLAALARKWKIGKGQRGAMDGRAQRRKLRRMFSAAAWRRAAPAAAALILIGLPVAISLWKVIIFGGQRYLTIAVGPLCLAAGLGIHRLMNGRGLAKISLCGALLVFLFAQGSFLKTYYSGREKRLWREAAELASLHARPGDVFAAYPDYSLWTLGYYNRAAYPMLAIRDVPAQKPLPRRAWVFALSPGAVPDEGALLRGGWRYIKSQNLAQTWTSTLVRVSLYEPPAAKPSAQ